VLDQNGVFDCVDKKMTVRSSVKRNLPHDAEIPATVVPNAN